MHHVRFQAFGNEEATVLRSGLKAERTCRKNKYGRVSGRLVPEYLM